jgi:MOSC domain-containing protein YiiM/ferredoxin-NADP reductase
MALQDEPNNLSPTKFTFSKDTLLNVRTGKLKPVFGMTDKKSGIFKTSQSNPVKVNFLGCEGDQHGYSGHGGPDKAILQYPSQHYPLWQAENPQNAHLFTVGGFGENLVTENADEYTICIGDILRIGKDVLYQVSEPRQPCFMLNHRFEMKDASLKSQNLNRTGWYCRILKEGVIETGDEIVLVERKYPEWTVANVQKYLYKDIKNEDAITKLSALPELGNEIKTIFANRLKKIFLDENDRLSGGEEMAIRWSDYRLIAKCMETPRISSFDFEAVNPSEKSSRVEPGSHVRVKLGKDGKLTRAYSIVSGDSNRFKLGIAFDPATSRGGSKHLHETVRIGDSVTFGEIKSDFPLAEADKHIFVAGGIGITAFLISAQQLQVQGLNYHLYYAVRSTAEIAFSDLLQTLKPNVTILVSSKGQRLDIPKILQKATTGTHIYVCGPDRLMTSLTTAARDLNFPASNIHSEAFIALTTGDAFSVELAESGRVLEVREEQTLLDVLRDAGLEVPSSCEVGNCGTCRVGVRSGTVEHRGTGLDEKEKEGSMLSCVSRGCGKLVLDF